MKKPAARGGFLATVTAARPKPAAKKPPPKRRGFVATVTAAKPAAKKTVKKAKKPVRRQLALGEGVACCSAEALAASLRLAGVPVSDGDVLDLYRRTAPDADAGASILATLEAAAEYGLASARPTFSLLDALTCEDVICDSHNRRSEARPIRLLLGISDPAPHAVLATADGWWSWGDLYEPWTDDIDEAWEVTW